MTKKLKNTELSYSTRKEYKFNQKFLIFLFFLVLSFIFWLLNALDHNYSTNISFPIKYIHQIPDKEMVSDVPLELTLNVSGQGYTLLRNIITVSHHPILLSVSSLYLNEIPKDTNRFFVITRGLKEFVQRQFGTELLINYIIPDTIFYTFSAIERKKVPVEPNINIEFANQYMYGRSIISQPDSIIISGPKILVDTIMKVQTEFKKFTKIDKSFTVELKLNHVEGVYFVREKVKLTVPVDKYTETSVVVPIKVINLPDSMEMKTFPASIKINYIVSLQNYNKVRPGQFKAIVDYKSIYSSINSKLKVTLERQPAFIKLISFRPKNVDYIIEK